MKEKDRSLSRRIIIVGRLNLTVSFIRNLSGLPRGLDPFSSQNRRIEISKQASKQVKSAICENLPTCLF